MNVGILGAVELHNRRTVAGVIPEVEGIAALGHVDDVLSMQGVVGHHTVHGFLHPQSFAVVLERRRGAGLVHLIELRPFSYVQLQASSSVALPITPLVTV